MGIKGPDRSSSQSQPENHDQQNRPTNKSRTGLDRQIVNNQPGSPVGDSSLQARTVSVNTKNHQPSIAPKPLTIELPSTPSHSDALFLEELEKIFEEKGQDGLAINKEGMHPIHYAAKEGLIHSVKYLLDNGDAQQLISLKNTDHNNLVHLAAKAGHADLLQWLYGKHGVDVLMSKGNGGFTALHFAAQEGHEQCVAELLKTGEDLQKLTDRDGNTATHLAASAGKLEVLRYIIQCDPETLKAKNNKGYTPLHLAAFYGRFTCVQELLSHNLVETDEDLLKITDMYGNTATHLAAGYGQLKVLSSIVQCDPETLKAKNNAGFTPLHLAAFYGKSTCVQKILSHNTVKSSEDLLKITDIYGYTATHLAAGYGQLEVLRSIVQDDPETLKAKNNDGQTPLHLAALFGRFTCVQELLSHKLVKTDEDLLKITDIDGNTATHLAARYGQLEVLLYIVQDNPETLKAKNNKGCTPLHLAAIYGQSTCVKELLSHNTVKKNLNRIDLFSDVFSNDAEIRRLLVDARKKNGVKRIPWSTADSKPFIQQRKRKYELDEWALFDADAPPAKHQRIGQSAEWPMMEDRKNGLSSLAAKAGAVLSNVKRVGIYLFNPVYIDETKEKFFSMGDLNGGVQMAKILESMGAQSLDVVLSPPDESSWSERSAYSELQKREYAEKQKVTRYKLARLWPEFDPAKPVPQTVMMGKCQVTFRDCDDQQFKPAPVVFSFVNAGKQYREVKELPDSIITLKPYRFAQPYVSITTDVQGNRGNVFPLSRPGNSIIPEIERSSIFKPGTINRQPLEKVINRLNEKSLSGELDLSVVYGLHHNKLSDESRGAILNRWINNIKAYSKQSVNQPVPTFIRRQSLKLA